MEDAAPAMALTTVLSMMVETPSSSVTCTAVIIVSVLESCFRLMTRQPMAEIPPYLIVAGDLPLIKRKRSTPLWEMVHFELLKRLAPQEIFLEMTQL